MTVVFDEYMWFEYIILKDQNTAVVPRVEVRKNSVQIPCPVTRTGTGKSAELSIFIQSGGLSIGPEGIQIIVSDSAATSVSGGTPTDFVRSRAAVLKFLTGDCAKLSGICFSRDIVEVYDLKGALLARDVAAKVAGQRNLRRPGAVRIVKVRPVR